MSGAPGLPSIHPHISVCIPTFRRPQLLAQCLTGVLQQEVRGFTHSIVVVDNDASESARNVVLAFRTGCPTTLSYHVEPIPNISAARNLAVQESSGDLIAFIDDDERPAPTWLLELFSAYTRSSADGVLGPVLPVYEGTPPDWLVKSGLCERERFATGTPLNDPKHMRSGNLLFARRLLRANENCFDLRLGRTGGEDTDFFERQLLESRRFVWCDEALVHEVVPADRQTLRYYVRRALLLGATAAEREPVLSVATGKSIVALAAYGAALPVTSVLGYHRFASLFVKLCNHLAKLLGHFGVRLVRERAG